PRDQGLVGLAHRHHAPRGDWFAANSLLKKGAGTSRCSQSFLENRIPLGAGPLFQQPVRTAPIVPHCRRMTAAGFRANPQQAAVSEFLAVGSTVSTMRDRP